jgi:hypothetical protein
MPAVRSGWPANISMKIVRFWNMQVTDGRAEVRMRQMLGLTVNAGIKTLAI